MSQRERIRSYFLAAIANPITDFDDIFEQGIVDSLFAIQLVQFVEKEFDISVEREDLDIDNFSSIDALTRFVERATLSRRADVDGPSLN